jgi:uncharacterized membrane protein
MSKSRILNVLTIAIWMVAAIGFLATVFTNGGPATYADDSQRRLIGGIFLAFGIFGMPFLRLLTRNKSSADHVVRDERDEKIDAKATRVGMIIVMLSVFLGSIALWEAYQDPGCVPVGWLWVLGYSALILSHLAPAIISLLLDIGVLRYAER